MGTEPLNDSRCGAEPQRERENHAIVCQLPAGHDGWHRCTSWSGAVFEWIEHDDAE